MLYVNILNKYNKLKDQKFCNSIDILGTYVCSLNVSGRRVGRRAEHASVDHKARPLRLHATTNHHP